MGCLSVSMNYSVQLGTIPRHYFVLLLEIEVCVSASASVDGIC